MTKRQRIGARGVVGAAGVPQAVGLSSWAPVDEAALSPQRREQFLMRKRAIELYLDGASDQTLQQATGLKRRNVYRLIVERCLRQAEDGTVLGWRGALPFLRVKGYTRHAPLKVGRWGGGAVGALQWIFASPKGQPTAGSLQPRAEKPAAPRTPRQRGAAGRLLNRSPIRCRYRARTSATC
ncbi:hypothetical protein [Azohydromonas australica]|uniref:hypothetical protein n=1 Tax=Azohydromonas australica TaxID=364039 RepID=UPI0003F5D283|nr:hypothetical protein [Azohydromonas australica]